MFGVIQLNAGVSALPLKVVVEAVRRAEKTFAMWRALQSPDRRIDENHGNGKCLGRYWSVALATGGLGCVVLPAGAGDAYGAPQYRDAGAVRRIAGCAFGLPRSWA